MHICFSALLCVAHYIFSIKLEKVIIVVSKKDYALRHPCQTRANTKIMSDIEQVQEHMKVDMETMKEQMRTMMEAMMSMRKTMEVNSNVVVATSTIAERDPTHPPGFDPDSRSISDVEGQGGTMATNTYRPHYVQSKSSFPPYGLPPNPNYTPPTTVYVFGKNIENQQPQPDNTHVHVSRHMEETHATPQCWTSGLRNFNKGGLN